MAAGVISENASARAPANRDFLVNFMVCSWCLFSGEEPAVLPAELCEQYFDSSPRMMESHLNVSRAMVELGLNERRTGIRCLDAYSARGVKKKKRFLRI